jgi:uncharacterized protein involved in exopolysaccharide biosynthesis
VDRLPVGWDEGPGLVASVWRYRWLVAAVALVGVLAGLGVSLVQPVMYEGSSRVLLVDPSSERVFQEGTGQPLDPDRYVRNQAAFMLSPPVLERAVRLVKGRVSVKQLRKRLTTEPSKELDLVTVRVRDRTAGGAAELADAVARAYEETAVQQARASVARTVAQLQATERSLRGRLEELEAKLRAAPSDAAVRVERDAVAAQLAQVDRRSQELGVEGAVGDPVRLREAAEVPESPVQPKPSRLAAVGLLLGLVVAAGLAWWLAWRRQVPATGQPAAAPGARPAAAGAALRSRLSARRRRRTHQLPDTAAFPGARPAGGRARLARVLRSRPPKGRLAAPVTLTDLPATSNGHHHSNGNGSGTLVHELAHWPGTNNVAGPSSSHDPDGDNAPQQG